ncbi:hypothetical protein BDF22DRAFT_739881 [Syncephalis plumigaleata]|nr:hypothetical protein BDF22DRAFT_739881 [Syncephalis plumigaleata]
MNIISITAVAALLLASIESAESMMRLFGNRRGEVVYQGKTISKKDAFGLSNLELVKVISQEDLNQPEGKIVQSFYEQHHLPINPDRVDYRAIQGGNTLAIL